MENKNLKNEEQVDLASIDLNDIEIQLGENIFLDKKLSTAEDIERIIERPVKNIISNYHNNLAQEKIDELDGEIYDFNKDIDNLDKDIDDKSVELLKIQTSIVPGIISENEEEINKHVEFLIQNHPEAYSKSLALVNEIENLKEEKKGIKSEKKHTMYNYESYKLYLDVCNISDCVEAYSVLNEFEEDESPQSIEDIDAEIREALKNESEKPQNIEIKEKIITYGELLLNSIKEGDLRPYNEEMDKLLY